MGGLSKNISRREVACPCGCGLNTIDTETVKVVQDVCDHFAAELDTDRVTLGINSAARCFEYNRTDHIGSNDASQHPRCRALDIRIKGVEPYRIYEYLDGKYPEQYGIGRYRTFTHIDTRSTGRARW